MYEKLQEEDHLSLKMNFKTKLQDLEFVLACVLPWPNLLSICAHSYLLECEGVVPGFQQQMMGS